MDTVLKEAEKRTKQISWGRAFQQRTEREVHPQYSEEAGVAGGK